MFAVAPTRKTGTWKDWLKEEYNNKAKFEANLRLARAAGIFLGAIVVFRNFGEAIFGP